MKQTKIYNILLSVVLVFTLALGIGMLTLNSSVAYSDNDDVNTFFKGTAVTKLENNSITSTVVSENTLEIVNPLIADNLSFETESTDVSKITLTFKTEDTVNRKVEIDGITSISGIQFTADKGAKTLTVSANGTTEVFNGVEIGHKCIISEIKFRFTVKEGATEGKFLIKSVAMSGQTQSFAMTDGKVTTIAKQVIALDNSNYTRTTTGLKLYAYMFNNVKVSAKGYAIFEKPVDAYLSTDVATIKLSNEDKPKSVNFTVEGANALTVKINEEVFETVTFDVLNKETVVDTTAPSYTASATSEEYKVFTNGTDGLLEKATKDGSHYIRLGSKFKVPSMKNLVADDHTSFDKMKHTLYYKTPNTSGSVSTWEIPTDKAGEYKFYVVFEDEFGNKMDADTIYKEVDGVPVSGLSLAHYVFTFTLQDDAPLQVTGSTEQPEGTVGKKYTAKAFTISSTGHTTTYELFFNANVDADASKIGEENSGWVSIPKASSVGADDVIDGLTYDQVKEIDYDGSLTFTPNKAGKYAIKCVAKSTNSYKADSDVTSFSVVEKPAEAKTSWLADNVWSVVFLSVGSLCLIAIIVLLFIKPKDAENK